MKKARRRQEDRARRATGNGGGQHKQRNHSRKRAHSETPPRRTANDNATTPVASPASAALVPASGTRARLRSSPKASTKYGDDFYNPDDFESTDSSAPDSPHSRRFGTESDGKL